MTILYSLGLGVGTQNANGEWLEVFYATPVLNPPEKTADVIAEIVGYVGGNQAIAMTDKQAGEIAKALAEIAEGAQAETARALSKSDRPLVATLLANDIGAISVPEAYLKLHLLSHRLVKPHGINLNGIFGVLPNVAWTNQGAVDLNELPERQLQARLNGELLEVSCVDKFPKM